MGKGCKWTGKGHAGHKLQKSLLCHKGTRSPRWPYRTVWTSRPSPECWDITAPGSRWTPTPTSPSWRRKKPPIRWAVSSPVLSSSFRTFPRMGHGLGQVKNAKIKIAKKSLRSKKSLQNATIPERFWRGRRDLNPRTLFGRLLP